MRIVSSLLVVASMLLPSALQATLRTETFKVYTEHPGVYQLTYEDLQAAGLTEPLASPGLLLTNLGEPVPIQLNDGGDDLFGPGDWIAWHGEVLHGEISYYHEHSRYNVYVLRTGAENPPRWNGDPRQANVDALRIEKHFEEDRLRLRLPGSADGPREEIWHWARLDFNAEESFQHTFSLPDLAKRRERVDLRLEVRGWSRPHAQQIDDDVSHHQVEVLLNGKTLTQSSWNGNAPHPIEIPGIRSRRFSRDQNTLELRVPRRRIGDAESGYTDLIDVVMLNWIKISYPRDPERAISRETLRPHAVVVDQPSDLADTTQADYIIVAHRKLIDAVQPLAELHRKRGLSVRVVDVEDIYDEHNHGIVDPRAIRDFLRGAHKTWQPPAPRFVLLVGDASFDTRSDMVFNVNYADWTFRQWEGTQFARNQIHPYDATYRNRRGLLPTWSYPTHQGYAASDNYFADVDGDHLPEMAIGRIPVIEPEDVTQVVDKIRAYIDESIPKTRNALFITNDSQVFQSRSDELAVALADNDFAVTKVYPSRQTSNESHSQRLVDAFDTGQFLVHFIGHGGRYIWRTGGPNAKKNHDLFTLEHLDSLRKGAALPVVLSLTCYSAPFDHPNADSIGEKLLRLDGRGAIAVVAASWRNTPQANWSEILVEEMTRSGTTIGEAFVAAKRRIGRPIFVATYNLLGDPAVPIALPAEASSPSPEAQETIVAQQKTEPPPAGVPPPAKATLPSATLPEEPWQHTIRWSTASEVDNFGYDVYRGDSPDGPFVRVTQEPVRGAGTSDEVHRYRFVDETIDPQKTYYYYVESISMSGRRERFTPVGRAKPKIPTSGDSAGKD